MNKIYTGIGSRTVPEEVAQMQRAFAVKLGDLGYTLRSGAASGSDTNFENGVCDVYFNDPNSSYGASASLAQIYIPWKGFVNIEDEFKDWYHILSEQNNKQEAEYIASQIHPAWDRCSRGAKALHARNVYQVLGLSLIKPSDFLVCYAEIDKNSDPKGGTRTAWVLAKEYISEDKLFNLYIEKDRKRIEDWLKN